jgi:hypothetical protein
MGNKRLYKAISLVFPKKNCDTAVAQTTLVDLLARVPIPLAIGLRCLFFSFWIASIFILFRCKTLGMLNDRERRRYFDWWNNNRVYIVRQGFELIKTVSLIVQASEDWEPNP